MAPFAKSNAVRSLAHLPWMLSALLAVAGAARAENAAPKVRMDEKLAAPLPASRYELLLRDADVLLKSGKPAEAYALLEPLEFDHAGETRFDYLIGIAALDSGKPDKATFAFERVLAVDPGFAAARLDLARAYYQLGDLPRARTEFSATLTQNPSAAARSTVQKYLDAIDAQQAGGRTRFSAYIGGALGRDSNINYSTGQSRILVDSFSLSTPVTLDPNNVKTADNYYAVGAGGEINHGLNDNWGLYAGGDLRKRSNQSHSQFNALGLDGRVGIMYETRTNRLRVGVLTSQYSLGSTRNYDTTGLKGEWRHTLSPANQINVLAQQVQYRFAEPAMQPNDFDQQAMGLGWLHALADGKSSLSGSLFYGTEKDVPPATTTPSPNGTKHFQGVRITAQAALNERTHLFASTGIQSAAYDKTNTRFLRQRNDRFRDMTVGANWHWDKEWTLLPQLSYSENNSNIVIYSYDRTDVSLTIRRDFR